MPDRLLRYAGLIWPVAFLGLIIFLLGPLRPESPQSSIVLTVESYYAQYGYWIIFGAAVLEGLFVFSWYFPGSAIVLLGAVFSAEGTLIFPFAILCGVGGFLISYTLDYYLGYYGWHRLLAHLGFRSPLSRAENAIRKYGSGTIPLAYVHPVPAVLIATAYGTLRMSIRGFLGYSLISLLFWGFFWGTLAYIFGHRFLEVLQSPWLPTIMVGVCGLWLLSIVFNIWKHNLKKGW